MTMKQLNWILPCLLWATGTCTLRAQTPARNQPAFVAQAANAVSQPRSGETDSTLSAQREKRALQVLFKSLQSHVVSVRTFGQQLKHLAATNHILAAAALGEEPPADAGDETGPETVRTKAEILDYLNSSFAHLSKAVDAIGDSSIAVRPSPISPLSATTVTRLSLIVEALVHTYDHYGQMVEYLRMNGIVPPASRKGAM
jgi:uncharacterized damage-inducible protein DinB